ncbi:unnamed protein product [Meganyctiphanes norvegica]|uniref:ACB domain-containing protein n=1 Tax=Meganyctiphanes norvegica TaxID=48144 RepID=A0AAV2PQR2_MEGNR
MKMAGVLRCCLATTATSSQHVLNGVSRSTTASQRLSLSLSSRCMSDIPPVSKSMEKLIKLKEDAINQTRLRTLALYKQVTSGIIMENRPGIMDVGKRGKLDDSKKSVSDISQEKARLVDDNASNIAEETSNEKYKSLLVKFADVLKAITLTLSCIFVDDLLLFSLYIISMFSMMITFLYVSLNSY